MGTTVQAEALLGAKLSCVPNTWDNWFEQAPSGPCDLSRSVAGLSGRPLGTFLKPPTPALQLLCSWVQHSCRSNSSATQRAGWSSCRL